MKLGMVGSEDRSFGMVGQAVGSITFGGGGGIYSQ